MEGGGRALAQEDRTAVARDVLGEVHVAVGDVSEDVLVHRRAIAGSLRNTRLSLALGFPRAASIFPDAWNVSHKIYADALFSDLNGFVLSVATRPSIWNRFGCLLVIFLVSVSRAGDDEIKECGGIKRCKQADGHCPPDSR